MGDFAVSSFKNCLLFLEMRKRLPSIDASVQSRNGNKTRASDRNQMESARPLSEDLIVSYEPIIANPEKHMRGSWRRFAR